MPTETAMQRRLVVILGTRAQVIKMAPVLAEMERRAIPFRLLMTGQHRETIDEILDEFGIATSRERIYDGPEVKGLGQAVRWMMGTTWKLFSKRDDWASRPRKHTIVLAHGDTFTTLIAALAARLCRTKVAHIEAGLRSFNWRHPFPEELTRIIVGRISDIAYCPGEWASNNLKNSRCDIVDTGANTILDALRSALAQPGHSAPLRQQPYAVVSVHRFENLYSNERMETILDTIQQLATKVRVVMVLHPSTHKRLAETGKLAQLEGHENVDLLPRMTYVPFMQLVSQARIVISDGGSNQEELSYMGIPTLLMRMATERQEGLGKNVILGQFDKQKIRDILKSLDLEPLNAPLDLPEFQPARIIVDDLQTRLNRA